MPPRAGDGHGQAMSVTSTSDASGLPVVFATTAEVVKKRTRKTPKNSPAAACITDSTDGRARGWSGLMATGCEPSAETKSSAPLSTSRPSQPPAAGGRGAAPLTTTAGTRRLKGVTTPRRPPPKPASRSPVAMAGRRPTGTATAPSAPHTRRGWAPREPPSPGNDLGGGSVGERRAAVVMK